MRLTRECDYAFVVIVFLAGQERARVISCEEMASELSMPFDFLAKILQKLSRAELIGSKQGPHGGYYLARTPSEITFTDVFRAIDDPVRLVECTELESCRCPRLSVCAIIETMRALQRAIVVLEDVEQRFRLTFSTDPHEAHRLAREMGRARCACNPVYDFIQSVLCTFQATISRVVLDDVEGKGIGALIYLRRADAELSLPCYPPDALALALRAKVPVYASAKVLAHAQALSASGTLPAGPADVSQWLEQLKPEDFLT